MSKVEERATLEALAQARFELIPVEGAAERAAHLPKGTTVTITCSPARGIECPLLVGKKLVEMGLRVVPHISARLVANRTHLEGIVCRLDDLGVREIFVIGGDAREPAGPFSGAFDLLCAMDGLGHAFEHIGIGGTPRAIPSSPMIPSIRRS
jgi:methylenetetrahydrofolate reductase (NADPH)